MTSSTDATPVWPDVEAGLLDYLADLAPGSNSTPSDLQTRLPWIRVRRVGGSDDGVTDTAQVDVEVFHSSRAKAYALASAVRERLRGRPPEGPGFLVDRVDTVLAPFEIENPNPNVTRFYSSFRLTTRRQ